MPMAFLILLHIHNLVSMKKVFVLGCIYFLYVQISWGQNSITLEDIFQKGTFRTNYVAGFNFLNDGKTFTRLEEGKINGYSIETGLLTDTLFNFANYNGLSNINSYALSSNEQLIMLETEIEPIYRHSYTSINYIFDRVKKKLEPLAGQQKVQYSHFNLQGTKVGYVFNNDLYYKDLSTSKINRITTDGKKKEIINGASDWVYEEEFVLTRAFEWNKDGQKIAFLKFNEKEVKQFTMEYFNDGVYPDSYSFKYPKVGEKNAIVDLFIYDTKSKKTIKINLGKNPDQYIPRIKWTQDPNVLCVTRMNRWQNHLELILVDAKTGSTRLLMEENNKYYIDLHDNLTFLENGKEFLWTSELSGFNHVYLYGMDGKIIKQLTRGDYEVTNLYGLDQKSNTLYYQAAEISPMQREIYKIDLNNDVKTMISKSVGDNNAQFSSTYKYWVNTFSTINKAASYEVLDNNGNKIRGIEDNEKIGELQKQFGTQPIEFLQFSNRNKEKLNAWMIKPRDFDPQKHYPVFMFLYGGPGSQQVIDNWHGGNYWWFQMLSQNGYIVVCVDNRGTGGRGEFFKKQTYLQLGNLETNDQIDAAKSIAEWDFVDKKRIGIFGWSYGGYMSSLCLFKGSDVFKAAIAVAPVTNWKWYDSIYTERYMRDEKDNEAGYRDNSPVYFADKLKGNYLLIHGMADDNVHFQNTAEMVVALVKANKQFDTYFYPNKNHGISGGNTRLHLFTKMTSFIKEKL